MGDMLGPSQDGQAHCTDHIVSHMDGHTRHPEKGAAALEGWGAQGEEQEDRGREETEEHPSRRHVARVPAWSCGKARQRPLEEGFVLLAQGPSKYQTLPGAHSGVAERSLITSEVSEEWGGERWDSPLSALLSFISPPVGTSQPKGDSAVTPV